MTLLKNTAAAAAAAAVTSAHSYDDMHSGGPPLHYTVLPPAGMLAQLSPLAVLNNNGFTRKLQVQATLLQAAAALWFQMSKIRQK